MRLKVRTVGLQTLAGGLHFILAVHEFQIRAHKQGGLPHPLKAGAILRAQMLVKLDREIVQVRALNTVEEAAPSVFALALGSKSIAQNFLAT